MNEKNSIKKEKQAKSLNPKKETMAKFFIIYQKKRQKHLFHLRAKVRGKWSTCWTLYPEVGWRDWAVFPRGECEVPVLQLQYKSGREPIYIWTEIGGGKGGRTLQNKTTNKQVVRRGLPIKDRILHKIK